MNIDLRSDTLTKPTPAMLDAMFHAQVGDDVFGEDPSVNELERKAADLFGMEAALFCPSGTMTNQIAIKCHTQPGDEVICEESSHVYIYEGGGIAFNSGCQVKAIRGDRGRILAEQAAELINPNDVHKSRSRLIVAENTANRGGGSCYDFRELMRLKELCVRHDMQFHLDGARLWNALVVHSETPVQYGQLFDSISVCLSKGLGTPVGSLLLGTAEFIRQARRIRKVFGGGMRQAGHLAAAGIFAMDHHRERLQIDHQHAAALANALSGKPFIGRILPVETNIVIAEVLGGLTPQSLAQKLMEKNIRVMAISPTQVRLVTHLDVSEQMVDRAQEVIRGL